MVLARAKQACHDEGEVGEVDSTAADKALALIEGAAGELDYLLDNADADPEKKVRKNTEKTGGEMMRALLMALDLLSWMKLRDTCSFGLNLGLF